MQEGPQFPWSFGVIVAVKGMLISIVPFVPTTIVPSLSTMARDEKPGDAAAMAANSELADAVTKSFGPICRVHATGVHSMA